MAASTTNFVHSHPDLGVSSAFGLVKRILNQLAEGADASIDRSRLAALPQRYLDDVGMTVGERAAIVGYEESTLDQWALVATQRL
jgi:phage-related protein